MTNTFHKSERLCSKKAIDALFGEEGSSMVAYPLRAVYRQCETPGVRILVSVSKRRFHHAVDRNRVKRQIREAYRKNKFRIQNSESRIQNPESGLDIAFLWIGVEHVTSDVIEKKMVTILNRITDSLNF